MRLFAALVAVTIITGAVTVRAQIASSAKHSLAQRAISCRRAVDHLACDDLTASAPLTYAAGKRI